MKSEETIRQFLEELQEEAKKEQPECPYNEVPIKDIQNPLLRGEIWALKFCLDLL